MNLSKLDSAVETSKPRTTDINNGSVEIELSKIYANPDQPRKHFDPVSLSELAESIRTHGLIQPISVVRRGFRYMIVSGERRFQASKILNTRTIRAHILTVDDHAVQEMAFIENIQREDLSDFEKAKFIGELWASGRYERKADLAAAIGKSPAWLSKAFGCLRLSPQIIADIEEAKHDIGLSVLEELSRIKDTAVQFDTYQQYIAGEITRDEFPKNTAKISRGKKTIKTLYMSGAAIMSVEWIGLKDQLNVGHQYKITIEEA